MEAGFWLERWENNQIGFHEGKPNAFLTQYMTQLELAQGARIFLPLCGKTLDIAWLLAQGYQVVGIELSEKAVIELFADLGVEPQVAKVGSLTHYQIEGLDIYQGDFFHLSAKQLGAVDAIYDRAAYVALPEEMRQQYAQHLMDITNKTQQLLVTLSYEEGITQGPPFSILDAEVIASYQDTYTIKQLTKQDDPVGLKGKIPVEETVWLLGA